MDPDLYILQVMISWFLQVSTLLEQSYCWYNGSSGNTKEDPSQVLGEMCRCCMCTYFNQHQKGGPNVLNVVERFFEINLSLVHWLCNYRLLELTSSGQTHRNVSHSRTLSHLYI